MGFYEGSAVTLVCCGTGEGTVCPCCCNYREAEESLIPGIGLHRKLDLVAWIASEDFCGYILHDRGYVIPAGVREKIKRLVKEQYKPGLRAALFFVLPDFSNSQLVLDFCARRLLPAEIT